MRFHAASVFVVLALVGLRAATADQPQRTLSQMPRYDRYSRLIRELRGAVDRGVDRVQWAPDGRKFQYEVNGQSRVFDLGSKSAAEGTLPGVSGRGGRGRFGRRGGGQGRPARGRQFDAETSPDGKLKATCRDRNVYLSDADGKNEVAVTTDGGETARIKYGVASWVYGEELEVREAMWFSPDGKKLAYYRFDESKVKDYYIAEHQLDLQDALDVEPYPKAGQPNPEVELWIYDIATKRKTRVDTTFGDALNGEYVYSVRWSPDGRELLFNRMPRKQNEMQFCAANPSTGACRVIVDERRADGWSNQNPEIRWLDDGKRFIWWSDRTGWGNYYLYDASGKELARLSHADGYQVQSIAQLDEADGKLYYTARDGDNPYLLQLHVVGLDGSGDRRLTDPKFSHTVFVAPKGGSFVDVAETLDTPPSTTVRDGKGAEVKELSRADLTKFDAMGLKRAQRFTFTAADGKTECYGKLSFPSDFDPNKKYPLLVFVYGGPESGGDVETFQLPNPITEFGFVVAEMNGRGTAGRGRAFMTAVYRLLGTVEIDDEAAGVEQLCKANSYLDPKRVGIQGTSYGGYFSALSILRYPNVYAAACASSPVTDFRLYDSVYTERYMGQPTDEDNAKGYDQGSCMTYASNLKGRLMLYFGTADNNVHPSNTIQLADALERAGKRYDMMVGADREHSQMNASRMWEYFIQYLILDVPKDALNAAWPSVAARRKQVG